MKIKELIIIIVIMAFMLTACGGEQENAVQVEPNAEPSEVHAIVLGDISDDPAEVI